MVKTNYTPKDILQKEFKTKMRGYDPIEVDEFLDDIIKDYESYNKEINLLKEENQRLQVKIEQMNKSQMTMSRTQTESPRTNSATNFDILKRISNLEKHVFGSKLNSNEGDTRQF